MTKADGIFCCYLFWKQLKQEFSQETTTYLYKNILLPIPWNLIELIDKHIPDSLGAPMPEKIEYELFQHWKWPCWVT